MSQKLTNRQKELKGIYKQYCDLPLNIVKQIIDYKSNKPNSLSKYIETIKKLNEKISLYESCLKRHNKLHEAIGNDIFSSTNVLIDYGNGYGHYMGQIECIHEILALKSMRDSVIARCKYEHLRKKQEEVND